MKIAVLPLMPSQGTPAYLGRQFSAFLGDQIRAATDADVNSVTYLTQVQEEDGPRVGFINFADMVLDQEQVQQIFEQSAVDLIVEGAIASTDTGFDVTVRFHRNGESTPRRTEEFKVARDEVFSLLHRLIKLIADEANLSLPEHLAGEEMPYGTDNAEAFLKFMEGYDGLVYVQQAEGRVVSEFSPQPAFEALIAALELDPDFLGPYEVLCEFARMCAHFRIGNFEIVNNALQKAIEMEPDEFRAYFALAELLAGGQQFGPASDNYEKALAARERKHKMLAEEGDLDESYNVDMAALHVRLGLAQFQAQLPVNAERNFRRALEFEGDDKQSLDYLAMVLQQTGREHEIPPLWKEVLDQNPQNAEAHVKYAVSLAQVGKQEESVKAFENALETVEENVVVKRFYAPLLAQMDELDRAMDFFEDALDANPTDTELLLQYAQTLQRAGRDFEIPKVLRDVLNTNPDPNTRAQTLAWLIELEQPKRAESVENAQKRMSEEDFEGAVRELRPLRNWLADYWKMWALLSAAYNKLNQFEDAEDAARRLLELFPGCEPAYGELNAALAGLGRTDEAYNIMRYAAMNMPQSLGVHLNLALAAKRAGHEDEARSIARQIREAVGKNEEIEPVLAEIER